MAGIQGQSTPKSVGNIQQQTPQPMPQATELPPTQAPAPAPAEDSIDYAALADQATAPTDSGGEIDYAALADQSVKSEPSFYDKMLENLGPTERVLAKGVVKGVGGTLAIPSAVGKAVADKVTTGQGDIGQEIINAYKAPSEVPSLASSIERISPSTKASINRNTIEQGKYPPGMEPLIPLQEPNTKQEPSNIRVSDLLGFGADIVGGGLTAKGVKLISKAAGGALEGISSILNEVKPASKMEQLTKPADTLFNNTKAADDAITQLKQAGLDVSITPAMRDTADPKTIKALEIVKTSPAYQALEEGVGTKLYNAIDSLPNLIAKAQGAPLKTVEQLANEIHSAKDLSGASLGAARTEAKIALGNKPLESPKFMQTFNDYMDKLTSPDAAKKLSFSSDKAESNVMEFFNQYKEILHNNAGKMPYADWLDLQNSIRDKAKLAYKRAGDETAPIWGGLRKALSSDEIAQVEQGLVGSTSKAAKEFAANKDNYHIVSNAEETIQALMDKSDLAGNGLVKYMLGNEQNSPDRMKAVMDVLGTMDKRNPQIMRQHMVNYLVDSGRTDLTSPTNPFQFDFDKFAKTVDKLAEGADKKALTRLDLVAGSREDAETLKNIANLSKRFAATAQGRSPEISSNIFGRMLYYGSQAKTGNAKSIVEGLNQAWKHDKVIAETINQMDIPSIVKAWPVSQRAEATKYIQKALGK